jgi:chemotaxis protein CheX
MNINEAIIETVAEVIPMFGMNPKFDKETEEKHLTSGDPVNVLIGFTNSLTGNIVLGLDKETALKLVSAMMGGMEMSGFDEMVKSGLGEMLNMLAGTTLRKIQTNEITDLSPPTVVTGDRVFLMINRVKSNRVSFQLESGSFSISYCIEKA